MPLRYSHFIVKHPICHINLYINTIIAWMFDWGRGWATRTHKRQSREETSSMSFTQSCAHHSCLWAWMLWNDQIFYFTKSMLCFFAHTPAFLSFCQLDLLRASQWPPGFCVRDQLKTFFTYHTSFSLCLFLVVQKENNFPYGVNIKYVRSYKSSCKYSEYL